MSGQPRPDLFSLRGDPGASVERRPVGSWVVLPVLLALAQAIVQDRMIGAPAAYSGVAIALALLLLTRRGGPIWPLGLAAIGVWALADVVRPSITQWEIGVTSTAVLLAVGLHGLPVALSPRERSWFRSIDGLAVVAALGSCAVAVRSLAAATFLGGFGLACVAVATASPRFRQVLARRGAALVVVMAALGPLGAWLARNGSGPQGWMLGAGLALALSIALAALPGGADAPLAPGVVERVVIAVQGRVDAVVRSVDASVQWLGRPLTSVGRWWGARTWPVPDAERVEQAEAKPSPARAASSYLLPAGAWAIGAALVPWLARVMNSYAFQRPFVASDLLRAPWSSDPTGRIGWGTGDYWAIADHGYRLSEHREAAFPLVGLLARWVHQWHHVDIAPAQVLVASCSGLAATMLFWAFLRQRRVAPRARVVALLAFVLYPYSFILFGYGYSDPTLVALVLASFLLVERRHPVLAGLVGALATLARPNALPLVAALLVFELVESGAVRIRRASVTSPDTTPAEAAGSVAQDGGRGWRPALRAAVPVSVSVRLRSMRPPQWGVLLSVLGVGAYSWWLIGHAGSPLYWLKAQQYYGHGSVLSPRSWLKTGFVNAPSQIATNIPWQINEAVAAAILIGAVALLPSVHRRLGPAYSVFVTGVLLIAWVGPRGFAPGGRYVLPALPFLLVPIAEWLEERARAQFLVFSVGVVGTALMVSAFVLGGELWLEW